MKDCPTPPPILVFGRKRCGICDTYFKPPFCTVSKGQSEGMLFVYFFFPTKRTKIKMCNICTRPLKPLLLDVDANGWFIGG